MILETWSHIAGITGLIALLFSAFLSYRKRLLNTGFTAFRELYRIEMDDFKKNVFSNVNLFREIMNENDERHGKTLARIVELYENTNKEISNQSNSCKLLQVEKAGTKKIEDLWKRRIKSELDLVQKDVAYIKKKLGTKN